MFFWQHNTKDVHKKIKENIKEELYQTLKKNGVNVSHLNIEMSQKNINVSVYINESSAV